MRDHLLMEEERVPSNSYFITLICLARMKVGALKFALKHCWINAY